MCSPFAQCAHCGCVAMVPLLAGVWVEPIASVVPLADQVQFPHSCGPVSAAEGLPWVPPKIG